MEFTKSIKIPLRGEDGSFLAEEKMWNPLVFAALVEFSEMEEDDDGIKYGRISLEEFIDTCTGDFRFSNAKAKETLSLLERKGLAARENMDVILTLLFSSNSFVTVSAGGLQYLYNEMRADRMSACVYVLLSHMRDIDRAKAVRGQQVAPWRFSVGGKTGNGLMKMCGYSPDNFNGKEKMKNILSKFEEDGILSASQPKTLTIHGRKAGKYRELWDFHDPKSKTSGKWVFIEEEQKDAWQAFLNNPDSPYRTPSPQMQELGNKMRQLHSWMTEMDELCQLWMDEE